MQCGEIKPEEVKKQQNIFQSNLNKISRWKFKSEEEKITLKNIKLLYESQVFIKLLNDYSSIVSEAKHKAKYGKGLKILTPQQMLQTLPIALAQVKAGNTSENLLNEIWQIIYSLYQTKEITEKVYNTKVVKWNGYYIYEF